VTFVDLTTPDSVTFTLDATTNVIVIYKAIETITAGVPANVFDEVMFNGVLDTATINQLTVSTASAAQDGLTLYRKASLAAGSNTIKVQHRVSAGTGQWSSRGLLVLRDL
jgi:hypothetical protein